MHTYSFTVTQCEGRKPSVVILDFSDITEATWYANQRWPKAIKVVIKPLRTKESH